MSGLRVYPTMCGVIRKRRMFRLETVTPERQGHQGELDLMCKRYRRKHPGGSVMKTKSISQRSHVAVQHRRVYRQCSLNGALCIPMM